MKCPKCGGEIPSGSKFCTFCGSQITYEMQREQEQLNKQGCPKCGSSNVQFQRENQGEFRNANSKQVVLRTVGFCKDCGYTWYPSGANSAPQKNNLVWWILGWIFFFPAPVMVLIWRKKNTWDIKVKIGVTIAFWIVFFIIGLSGGGSDSSTKESTAPTVEVTTNNEKSEQASNDDKSNDEVVEQVTTEDTTTDSDEVSDYDVIDTFIEKYNAIADKQLTNPVEIDIQAPEHYRTEFRLNAYKGAVAKQCTIDNTTVDIVNYGSNGGFWNNDDIRMYLTTDDAEFAVEFFNSAVKVLDPTATDDDIAKANDNIRENKSSNYLNDVGYYYIKSYNELFVDSKIKGFYDRDQSK